MAFTDVATVGVDEAQLVALRSQALGANRPRVLLDDLDALGPVPDPVTPGAEQPVLLRFSEPVALVALVRYLGVGLPCDGGLRGLVVVASERSIQM